MVKYGGWECYNCGMSEKGQWIPDKYASKAPLGEAWKTPLRTEMVEAMAGAMDKVVNAPVNDDPAKRKRNKLAESIVLSLAEEGAWETDNVGDLIAASEDVNRPANQKLSKERLDILTGGLYYAIKEGDNEDLKIALDSGSAKEIDKSLPDALKGLGEKVVDIEIKNPIIRSTLKELDEEGRDYKRIGSMGKEDLAKNIKKATMSLVKIDKDNLTDKEVDEFDRIFAYLAYEYDSLVEATQSKSVSDQASVVDTLSRLVDAITSQNKETTGSTYDTFVTAEFLQQPIQLQVDTFPPPWFKEKPEWFDGDIGDWQQIIRARINLTNASYIKAEVAALDGQKAKENSYLKLTERELGLIYEMPGVKNSMEGIINDFFMKDGDVDNGFFLALKKGVVQGASWEKSLASFRRYQVILADKIARDEGLSDINAKAAVSMAWNFLYVSNVFESADSEREISGGSGNVFGEQIRSMIHPLSKAMIKFGVEQGSTDESRSEGTEEGWGGKIGNWFADMVTWDDTRKQFIKGLKDGTMQPYPKRIGASMIELMKIETIDGKEMSMAEALISKKKIAFNKTDSNLFGDYGDKWDTFWKYYLYSSGKNELQYGKNNDEWTTNLADIFAKLKKIKVIGDKKTRMFDDLMKPEAVGWMILNAFGMKRSPTLMAEVGGNFDYSTLIRTLLRAERLMPSHEDRQVVLSMLNARPQDAFRRMKVSRDELARNIKSK